MLNLFTHGIISPMLFLIVGVIYDRAHHREIAKFGGLAQELPEYSAIMGLAFFASLGLPGLAGFISEFMVFSGAFPVFTTYTIISATSVIITAAYYLWAIHRMFLGKLNPAYKGYPDLNWRERLTLYPLGAIAIFLGFYPQAILEVDQHHPARAHPEPPAAVAAGRDRDGILPPPRPRTTWRSALWFQPEMALTFGTLFLFVLDLFWRKSAARVAFLTAGALAVLGVAAALLAAAAAGRASRSSTG